MGQKKNAKLEDIANELGVSIVTVSNALNERKGVSDELRNKIQKAAHEIGYRNVTHSSNKELNSYIIGVMVAEKYVKEFPSFYMEVYKRVAQEAVKKGHLTVLEVVTSDKENLTNPFEPFLKGEIAGLILIGELKKEYIQVIRKAYEIPIVCVDYYDIYEDMDYIVTDSFGGMERMTELLLEQGYRELMFVGTPNATKSITDRYLGYCKALEKVGIIKAQKQVICDRNFEAGDYRIEFDLPEHLPEAFVCNSDKTASILLNKLEQRKIRIPEDVSVVSFDNYNAYIQKDVKLTTYENDEKIIAQISVSTLLKRIDGRKCSGGVRVVEGNIVIGNTVKNRRNS